MRLLIGTHVFLWMNDAPEQLSAKVRNLFVRGDDELFLSIASPWEVKQNAPLMTLRASTTPVARARF